MRERYETYLAWLPEQGLPTDEGCILNALNGGKSVENAAMIEEMLRQPNRPTAIFAVTDDLAAEVLDAARNVGLTVPGDLSVIGFDDILLASLTVPKLTTVRLPLLKMGQQAAKLLIDVIEERRDPAEQAYIETPELIVRHSTACPPSESTKSIESS
jgi:LacI family xylobiose transport system transcriptional regulator